MNCILATHLLCAVAVLVNASLDIPTREVAPGVQMPVVMIGTGKSHAYEVSNIINGWMDLGGHGVDTAYNYGDQTQIAKTIAERGLDRKDLFFTSKIPGCLNKNATRTDIELDLKQLNTSYLDLMLIHYPRGSDCAATWEVLEDFHRKGVLKAIGVSNFLTKDLQDLLKTAQIKPAVNQIHYSIFSRDEDTIRFSRMNNITVQSYSPLNAKFDHGKSVFSNPTVVSIGEKHKVSAAQVALRWILHRGDILTFLSGNETHMKNDADLFGFDLDDEDVGRLNSIQNTTLVV
jgi:diketogulonate reductase-like aldo/keto reductase